MGRALDPVTEQRLRGTAERIAEEFAGTFSPEDRREVRNRVDRPPWKFASERLRASRRISLFGGETKRACSS